MFSIAEAGQAQAEEQSQVYWGLHKAGRTSPLTRNFKK